MSVIKFVLFSVALCSAASAVQSKQHNMRPMNRKKYSGFIYSIVYRKTDGLEVDCYVLLFLKASYATF